MNVTNSSSSIHVLWEQLGKGCFPEREQCIDELCDALIAFMLEGSSFRLSFVRHSTPQNQTTYDDAFTAFEQMIALRLANKHQLRCILEVMSNELKVVPGPPKLQRFDRDGNVMENYAPRPRHVYNSVDEFMATTPSSS